MQITQSQLNPKNLCIQQKRRYPHMFEDWSDSDSRRENSKKLMKFAHKAKVANEDEPGDPQVNDTYTVVDGPHTCH